MTKVMSKTKGSIKSTIPSIRFSGGPKRLPDESTPAYRAFRVYLNQGPGRTLDLAWQFYCLGSGGKQHVSARRPGHWSRWSARHHWLDRAAAHDKLDQEKTRKSKAEGRRKLIDNTDLELLTEEPYGPSAQADRFGDRRLDGPPEHEKTKKRGRRSIITPQLREKFCNCSGMSGSIETAILLTGIGRSTYYRWQRRVRDGVATRLEEDFIRESEAACANPKLRNEILLRKHGEKHWRANAFWLERKYSAEYGRRRPRPLGQPDVQAGPKRPERVVWAKVPLTPANDTPAPKSTVTSENAYSVDVEHVSASAVTGWLREMPGLKALAGRLLTTDDDLPDAPPTAVITHRYWTRRFAGNQKMIGQSIQIEGVEVTIIGVIPPEFTTTPAGQITDFVMPENVMFQLRLGSGARMLGPNYWMFAVVPPNNFGEPSPSD